MKTDFPRRRQKLRQLLRKSKSDAILVTDFTNVTYLTGFTGDDSYLLVTLDGECLVTDQRYTLQLSEECPDLELIVRGVGQTMRKAVVELVGADRIEVLGVEAGAMTVGLFQSLEGLLADVALEPLEGLVERLRIIKDRQEIEATRRACLQARRAYEVVRAGLTDGMTEREIATELEYQIRRLGAKGLSFPPIVAVGPRGALPHATPTNKRVAESDFTLFDWGANEGLYVSDLTRMATTRKPSAKFAKIYDIVLRAQKAAIEAIRPDRTCREIDAVARKIIAKAGYDKQFRHGLGHGIGLQVHESPNLNGNQAAALKPGMIITVEPGIYLPGWGGIRIEDDVLVTRSGYEVLTDVPKEIEDCAVG